MPASPARLAASITSRTLSASLAGPYGSVGWPSVKKKMIFSLCGFGFRLRRPSAAEQLERRLIDAGGHVRAALGLALCHLVEGTLDARRSRR